MRAVNRSSLPPSPSRPPGSVADRPGGGRDARFQFSPSPRRKGAPFDGSIRKGMDSGFRRNDGRRRGVPSSALWPARTAGRPRPLYPA